MKTTTVRNIAPVVIALMLGACANEMESASSQPAAIDASTQGSQAESSTWSSVHEPSKEVAETIPASEVLTDEHSGLLALSDEEAAWLARHGYPSPEEMEALSTYDVDELESAMRNRRDPKAAALLGHRRAREGDLRGAVSAFSRGANLGSLYARQQLAIVSAQRATGLPAEALAEADQGNLGVMVAQLEVARMLGDHRAQALIDKYAVNFDWEYYGKHVLTQTAEFMRQYGEGARARGGQAMGPDPRPNADAWAQLQSDPGAMVTIYKRDPSSP